MIIKSPESFRAKVEQKEENQPTVEVRLKKDAINKMRALPENGPVTIELLRRLPERLVVKPGLQLIVGTNGIGKSTILKGMYWEFQRNNAGKETLEELGSTISDAFAFKEGFYGLEIAELFDTSQTPFISETKIIFEDYTPKNPLASSRQYESQTKAKTYRSSIEAELDAQDAYAMVDIDPRRKFSSRESKEQLLRQPISDGSFVFIDEPEIGISPRRHIHLKDILQKRIGDQSSAVIATNSPLLLQSDLPRLDLNHPERGFFTPAEYQDDTIEQETAIETRLLLAKNIAFTQQSIEEQVVRLLETSDEFLMNLFPVDVKELVTNARRRGYRDITIKLFHVVVKSSISYKDVMDKGIEDNASVFFTVLLEPNTERKNGAFEEGKAQKVIINALCPNLEPFVLVVKEKRVEGGNLV